MKKSLIAASLLFAFSVLVVTFTHKGKEKTLGIEDIGLFGVRGLIIPHHDLADELIINTLERLAEVNSYDTVFVIGPNHFFPESETVVTAEDLEPFPVDSEFVVRLNSEFEDVTEDPELVKNEHSINIPTKYIYEYFPEVRFVPLVVSPYYNEDILSQIALFTSESASDKSLFVLAVDFSHDLGMDEALKKNEESIGALSNFDYQEILTFTDENLDSPVATVLFLKILKNLEATEWTTLHSTHGSVIQGVPDLSGTSYVVGTLR